MSLYCCSSCRTDSKYTGASVQALQETGIAAETGIIKSRTFLNADSTFGYMIFVNGRMTVYQRSVPYSRNNTGFVSERDAKQVAEFICRKMQKSNLSGNISRKELDSLGVTLKTE